MDRTRRVLWAGWPWRCQVVGEQEKLAILGVDGAS